MTQAPLRPFYGGWRPSLPDKHDYFYTLPARVTLPDVVDWRQEFLPNVLDQDGLGSCTSFAGKYALEYAHYFQNLPLEDFSELFLYYNIRRLEHTTDYDSGGSMRDIPRALKKWGITDESKWPYIVSQFTTRPPDAVYRDARQDIIKKYERVRQTRRYFQTCLATRHVLLVGISVYDSFLTQQVAMTGRVPMPDLSKETLQGGHALCFLGYDNDKQVYLGINSWGEWGIPEQPGTFTIPYQYLEDPNLAGDCWTLDIVQ